MLSSKSCPILGHQGVCMNPNTVVRHVLSWALLMRREVSHWSQHASAEPYSIRTITERLMYHPRAMDGKSCNGCTPALY